MDGPTLDGLTRRLDHLERGLRRWRALGSLAWLLLASGTVINLVLLFGPGQQEEPQQQADADEEDTVEDKVQARSFVLVDEDGKPRALLGLRADGTPALAFSDAEGKVIWKAP